MGRHFFPNVEFEIEHLLLACIGWKIEAKKKDRLVLTNLDRHILELMKEIMFDSIMELGIESLTTYSGRIGIGTRPRHLRSISLLMATSGFVVN